MNLSNLYSDGLSFLLDELRRLEIRLQIQVLRARRRPSAVKLGGLAGVYIDGEEIDRMFEPARENGVQDEEIALKKKLVTIGDEITARLARTEEPRLHLPLTRLSHLFHLTPFESGVLIICLAPEIDSKYEKIYAYLQDDITRKQPGVDLILELMCPKSGERLPARESFLPGAPLFKYRLLEFIEDGGQKTLLSRALKVEKRIVDFLLGFFTLDSRLASFTRYMRPEKSWEDIVMTGKLKKQLMHRAKEFPSGNGERGPVYYFWGPPGTGKKTTAEAFCRELGVPLLLVDALEMMERGEDADLSTQLLFREVLLQSAAVYVENFGLLIHMENQGLRWLRSILKNVGDFAPVTFLSGDCPWPGFELNGVLPIPPVPVHFPIPDYPLRRELWQRFLGKEIHPGAEAQIDEIAGKFRLTGGQIRSAAVDTTNRAVNGGRNVDPGDLASICRSLSNQRLSRLAQKIPPHYCWEDIILPRDKFQQLKEMSQYTKYRQKVLYEWGFIHKLSLGKGCNALFCGPSGTGKTMAAEVIAQDAGLDLYKIDLSRIVSKYIGETEKNLSTLFTEAETGNAILFFDEADALFGKRSEVKDAHDRYANIEVGYLLQQMEEYTGVVILATNLKENLDEAFVRRMHFTVEFPFPDEESRLRIWKNIFPGETPLDKGIDYEFLKKRFKVSGGHIKNIALMAAFFAAHDGGFVSMEHLVLAGKREFQKMGKMIAREDFGPYYDFILAGGGCS